MEDKATRFYSAQTRFYYEIQRDIYQTHYIFVAMEFNPLGNHPTSRPYEIIKWLCRIQLDIDTEKDKKDWEDYLERLQEICERLFKNGVITKAQRNQATLKIVHAEATQDAQPILMVVTDSPDHEFEAGHIHEGYEETEQERIIINLQAENELLEVHSIQCDDLDMLLKDFS